MPAVLYLVKLSMGIAIHISFYITCTDVEKVSNAVPITLEGQIAVVIII